MERTNVIEIINKKETSMFSVRQRIDKCPDFNVNTNLIKSRIIMSHNYTLHHWFQFDTSLFGKCNFIA